MDEMITEIDNDIIRNMKSLSSIKYSKQIFNKIHYYKNTKSKFKKILSASIINPKLKDFNRKIRIKSNISLGGKILSGGKKKMNNISTKLSKSLIMKNIINSYCNKEIYKDRNDSSASLSTLIKTNTSFFNTSNFNFNTDRKNILKKNIYNNTNPNINNENKIDDDNKYFVNISFNKYINDYLHKNKYFKNYFSCSQFLEAIRMIRKAKIINSTLNQELTGLKDNQTEQINSYNSLEFEMKNNQKLFYIYFKCLQQYLIELSNIIIKERGHLLELKSEKDKLKKLIIKKNNEIKKVKETINKLNDLKIFLIQVKYGKSIDQIPIKIKKEYGFLKEVHKENEKERRGSQLLPKELINSDAFKKKLFSLFAKKKPIKKSQSIKSKSQQIINKPIFDNPEQFMSCLNLKTESIKENISLYWDTRTSANEVKLEYNKIFGENEKYLKIIFPEEERLLQKKSYEKKRNSILKEKVDFIKNIYRSEKTSLKNIAEKLQKIFLNIESQLEIKELIYEKNLESFLLSQRDIFSNINGTSKFSTYILKIIEMVTEVLLINKNKIKKNKKLKDFYSKFNFEIERNNNYNRHKLQISFGLKKTKEKNKKVLDRIYKIRLASVFNNRRRCLEEHIPEKILLKRKLESKKEAKYFIKYEEEKNLFTFT